MAKTKRKRRSKHRGTAAGTVEARGRTGRKLEAGEKRAAGSKGSARKPTREEVRAARLGKPPTLRSALNRALLATVVFFVVILLLFKRPPVEAAALSAFMLVLYIPLGYYTDLFLHRRYMRKQAEARKGG